MPRKSREKDPSAIYHIMCKSISEILLFRNNEDKDYYLKLLKRYNDCYKASLYGYCLMNNHLHLHFNGNGIDISRYMHSLNTAYIRYYNTKYKRHGPLFQGRFKSQIVNSDQYNLALTAYIHNNPKDIEGYNEKEEHYPYSSYGIYLGKRADKLNLIDKSFIYGLFGFKSNNKEFVKKYFSFVSKKRNIESVKLTVKEIDMDIKDTYEYISGKKTIIRDHNPKKIISFIADKLAVKKETELLTKSNDFRSFTAYILRILCGQSYKDICNHLYNTTISGCSSLCKRGQMLINGNLQYEQLFNMLLKNQLA